MMIKKVVVSLLVIIEIISIFLVYKTRPVEDVVLEDVKLKEEETTNNGFALMLEQDDGTYEESSSNIWPTDMKFNSELSGCIDVNGNKIDNALSFNTSTNSVMVSTNKTAYCYVYFDIKKFCEVNETLSNCIIRNSNEGVEEIWDMTAEIGIDVMDVQEYRYVGTNPSNYICFGTTDKDTCLNDTDKYMYRIIGVFEDSDGNKHAKLIKKEALNTAYAWNSNYFTDVDWNNSDLYNGLNGSYFLSNEDYPYMQDTTWTDKITTWNYTMTNTKTWENYNSTGTYGLYYNDNTNKVIYLHELNRSSKSSETCYYDSSTIADCNVGEWKNLETKISLMYASDYALSLGEVALNYVGTNNYSSMKTGWMHISNNDSGTPSSYEWTMSRSGSDSFVGFYDAWFVSSSGKVNSGAMDGTDMSAVRSVFFLSSDVEYTSGTGTLEDPFIIS